jgi:hypothetical protein
MHEVDKDKAWKRACEQATREGALYSKQSCVERAVFIFNRRQELFAQMVYPDGHGPSSLRDLRALPNMP